MPLLDLEQELHVLWPYPVARIWNASCTETIQVFCHSTVYALGVHFIANCRRFVKAYDDGGQLWTSETLSAVGLAALIEQVRPKYPLIDAPYWTLE